MKKINQLFVVLLLLVAGLASCTNYGKKIKVGAKAEVYYKEGVTEAEATKLGDYLKKAGFMGNEKEASVQVAIENGEYTVRFVYDKEYFDKNKALENDFKSYGVELSKEVFDGKKVNIALADDHFKDFKKIPYDEAAVKVPEREVPEREVTNEIFSKEGFDHEKAGGVSFYWKGISDEESKTIADYIVENGAFAGGTAEIYMTKEGDRYLLRFPVKEEYRNDAAMIAEIKKVSAQIKENVFANNPYTFQMTDERLKAVRSFDY